jgi:hypothetical protein
VLAYKFTRPEGQGTFPELWVVELAGEVTESPHKLVAPRGAWSAATSSRT